MIGDGMDVNNFIVKSAPERVHYIPDFISKDLEERLQDSVYRAPKPRWTQLQNRRLQNWGGVPHSKGMIAEEIPLWLKNVMENIANLGVFGEKKPNHVLINEYIPGQGILPHLDGPLFYPTITTLNLGSHGVLNFYKTVDGQTSTVEDSSTSTASDLDSRLEFSLLLEPKSLLVLQETCYHKLLHGIDETHNDKITDKILNRDKCLSKPEVGDVLTRGTRLSLTIRHVPKATKPILRLGR